MTTGRPNLTPTGVRRNDPAINVVGSVFWFLKAKYLFIFKIIIVVVIDVSACSIDYRA